MLARPAPVQANSRLCVAMFQSFLRTSQEQQHRLKTRQKSVAARKPSQLQQLYWAAKEAFRNGKQPSVAEVGGLRRALGMQENVGLS